jgi:hypothetical protein
MLRKLAYMLRSERIDVRAREGEGDDCASSCGYIVGHKLEHVGCAGAETDGNVL